MTDIMEASGETGLQDSKVITEQEIRDSAYHIFECRGGQDGHAEQDWYQAESELLSQRSSAVAA